MRPASERATRNDGRLVTVNVSRRRRESSLLRAGKMATREASCGFLARPYTRPNKGERANEPYAGAEKTGRSLFRKRAAITFFHPRSLLRNGVGKGSKADEKASKD